VFAGFEHHRRISFVRLAHQEMHRIGHDNVASQPELLTFSHDSQ
jgi:hypothetical protein